MSRPAPPALIALSLLGALHAAHAGRPLSTDDAGVAPQGTCQFETWVERSDDDKALILSPACGVAPGLELGGEYAVPHPDEAVRATSGLAMKWEPGWGTMGTPVGDLSVGLKLAASFERPQRQDWRGTDLSALLLASLSPSEAWAVHANVGVQHLHHPALNAALANVAVTWSPSSQALLFAEAQLNDRPALLGRTVRTAGGRWWLYPDRLGLDLTASREAGTRATTWSLGLGWYGIGL